jgi:hypothetical protein
VSPQRAAQREADENARRLWSVSRNLEEAARLEREGKPVLAAILYETNGRLYRRVGDHKASREAWRKSRELRAATTQL